MLFLWGSKQNIDEEVVMDPGNQCGLLLLSRMLILAQRLRWHVRLRTTHRIRHA
jgi:hypothetical protein